MVTREYGGVPSGLRSRTESFGKCCTGVTQDVRRRSVYGLGGLFTFDTQKYDGRSGPVKVIDLTRG